MKKIFLVLAVFLLVFSVSCNEEDTSSLKDFSLEVKDFSVQCKDSRHFGISVKAQYKTDSVETLKDYGLVFFIRGCKFCSEKVKDGEVRKYYGVSKYQFGGIELFYFPNWTIDSLDKDPLYNGHPGKGRLYYYRWFDEAEGKAKIYGREKPKTAKLYVVDHPGTTAFIMDGIANNISLEIKICIYKMKDIPNKIDNPKDINFAKPIKCFTVLNSYVYNHDTGKFESKKEIDPFCLNK